jgi:hypothetical protein
VQRLRKQRDEQTCVGETEDAVAHQHSHVRW